MRKPNFFILGAPKSGTTAMNHYLAGHPHVFMSDPKEPAFFASDYPRLKEKLAIKMDSIEDYLALFAEAKASQDVVGEASTAYLSSDAAVEAIMAFNPDSRLLVMLRNPVDFVSSFHSQKLIDLVEDETDFEKAWGLQADRAAGRSIPVSCLEPKFLQYAEMGAFGTQVDRLLSQVDREQVKIILFDEFVRSPGDAYREVLAFLDISDDGRTAFPLINEAREHRLSWMYRLLMTPAGRRARRLANHHPLARNLKQRVIFKPKLRVLLREAFRDELVEAFLPEVVKLEQILGRDLSDWKASA